MDRRELLVLAVLLFTACVDSAVVGGTPDGLGSSGSTAASTATSTTSTGQAGETGEDTSDSGDEFTSSGSADNNGTNGSSGTDESACDLETLALAYSSSIVGTPIECGDVHFEDPAADWVAVHDCIEEQQEQAAAFVAFYQVEGVDGHPRFAALGLEGNEYPRIELAQLPSGFAGVPSPIHLRQCSTFAADPDCTPMSGTLCIECEIVSSEQLCP